MLNLWILVQENDFLKQLQKQFTV